MPQMIHIHIVDHLTNFGDGLQNELTPFFPHPPIITRSKSISETVVQFRSQHPHLFILSTNVLGKLNIASLLEFKKIFSRTKIALLLTEHDAYYRKDAWTLIVNGAVRRSDPMTALVPAVITILDGFNYFSPAVRQWLAEYKQGGNQKQWPPANVNLSDQDWHILTLLGNGLGNQQIASELNLAHKTIRNRLTTIYKTIGVLSRAEAMSWAIRHGLPIDEP